MRYATMMFALILLMLISLPTAAFEPCWLDQLDTASVTTGYYGRHVAIGGDLVVLGLGDNFQTGGGVVVFRRTGSEWVEEAVLIPDDLVENDSLGRSVATDGQRIFAGAPEQENPGVEKGAVYVFEESGGQWVVTAKLTVPLASGWAYFGTSLSLHGDRVLVGAPYYSIESSYYDAAFVFRREGADWVQEAMLTQLSASRGGTFGNTVSLGDELALVGDYQYAGSGNERAHVFRRNGTEWTREAELTPNDPHYGQRFSFSVAINGDQALVGAPWDEEHDFRTGAVYVFTGSDGTWTQTQKLVTADPGYGAWFGTTVVAQGEYVLASAPARVIETVETGLIYLFRRDGALWYEEGSFVPDVIGNGDFFGEGLAMAGSLAVCAAPFASYPDAIHVYGLDGESCGPTLIVSPGPGESNPNLVRGFSIRGVANGVTDFDAYDSLEGYGTRLALGDINGDGYGEIITGPGPGPAHPPLVRAFTVDGTRLAYAEFTAYGVDKYGVNVACGDLDGDGYDEIVTGAGPGAVFGPHVRGWDVDGVGADPLAGVNLIAYGTQKYGVNVACGDLDGDGFDEIITGAGPGAVFGPHVRGWNVDDGTATAIPGISYFAYGTLKYGVNVALADVDGDGYDEILTGPGPGAVFGPHVRGWNYDGAALAPIPGISFFAYGTLKWGVRVKGVDLDGDGDEELITAPGPGSVFSSHIRGFDYDGSTTSPLPEVSFFAYEDTVRYGADLAAGAVSD